MKVEIAADTMVGKRDNQQDCFVYRQNENMTVAAVCDGMGGLNGGEIASRVASEAFINDMKSGLPLDNIPAFLEREAKLLDEKVFSLKNEKGQWLAAGTTIASVVILDDKMYFMTVGDSRILIARGNEMIPVNREHNFRLKLDALLEEGCISKEDYQKEEYRADQLVSYLGYGNITVWDVSQRPITLEKSDRILLCSDGVTKTILPEDLESIVCESQSAKHVVLNIKGTIEKINYLNQDNATFVVLECR